MHMIDERTKLEAVQQKYLYKIAQFPIKKCHNLRDPSHLGTWRPITWTDKYE